jgi:hypothetical protein
MQNGAEDIASQHGSRATRRGVLRGVVGIACLGVGAGLAGVLWTRKNIGARLFNPSSPRCLDSLGRMASRWRDFPPPTSRVVDRS